MRVAVLIPVLDRPERVNAVIESIEATANIVELRPLFLASPNDDAELAALAAADIWYETVPWLPGRGDYAKKMNRGVEIAVAARFEFVFYGADDLLFHPGWVEHALATWQETRACVIGTNDLGNSRVKSGDHATHSLVHLGYLGCGGVDAPELLHEGYHHNFVDDEFIQVAKHRGLFAMALNSRVEHMHPDWGKGVMDKTYEKGKENFGADKTLYNQRCHLWAGRRR